MMKLIGAVCIILATTLFGFEASKKLTERPRQLRQLKVALQSLEAEIMFGHTHLSEASHNLSKQLPKPLTTLFKYFATNLNSTGTSVSKAWEESLDKIWEQTAFGQGEYEVLRQFGETLGQHDREHQRKHIRLALAHLEREELDALEKQGRYEKMLKSFGVLTGLLIVILLM